MTLPEPLGSLAEVTERLATSEPGRPSIVTVDQVVTCGVVAARARVLAAGWRRKGGTPGDVIGIYGEGGLAFTLAFLSATRAGLVPLLLDPRLTDDELHLVLSRARPRAIAVCDGAPARSLVGPALFVFDERGCEALEGHDESIGLPGADRHAPAVLLVTSGTSGHVRVVALSAANLSANLRAAAQVHEAGPDDVVLSLLPVTHAFEFTTAFLGPLLFGATVVYPAALSPVQVLTIATRAHVTRINVVPALLELLLDAADLTSSFTRNLRCIGCGGAPLSPAVVDRAVHAGLPLWIGYGLTEASPLVAMGRADSVPRGSVGRVLPGVQVRIEDGTGEILVRGDNVMCGYVGDDPSSRGSFRAGWLRTGDLGCVDPDGYLHVVGRANDVIVTAAGEKVAPDDIELAYRSPLFAEVCAVGKGDEGAAQKPHLVVVPCPQRRPSFTEIQAEFVRLSRAAGRHRALGLTISTEPLPRTRTLKVRRHLVRERIWTPTSSAIGTA